MSKKSVFSILSSTKHYFSPGHSDRIPVFIKDYFHFTKFFNEIALRNYFISENRQRTNTRHIYISKEISKA